MNSLPGPFSPFRNPRKLMAWPCSKCTFLNPPTQKSTCQICLSPSIGPPNPNSSSSSSSSSLQWPCEACSFLNTFDNTSCEICGTRAKPHSLSHFEIDEKLRSSEELDASVAPVSLPLQRCKRKNEATGSAKDSREAKEISNSSGSNLFSNEFLGKLHADKRSIMEQSISGIADPVADLDTLKILTYNVWFREDLEMRKRMEALGDLIQHHCPHLICFQEVTPNIYEIFRQSSWWEVYKCSVSKEKAMLRPYFCMQLSRLPVTAFNQKPFGNSIMGRELCIGNIDVGKGKELIFATSHLESPCPAPPRWDQMYSKERVAQAKESLKHLEDLQLGNTIFGGDMNWDEKSDGQFPLSDGWIDAWMELRPGENGWTYDTKANRMLSGNRALQKRLDRFVCRMRDFKVSGIEMIGMEAIPGLTYCKEKKVRNALQKLMLPVLPSDHYGLLLRICRQ